MSAGTTTAPAILAHFPENAQHPYWNLLQDLPLPSSKHELWKYTRTGRITQQGWSMVANSSEPTLRDIDQADGRIVIVDGNYCASYTALPDGVTVTLSKDSYHPHTPAHFFEALSFVYNTSIIDIHVGKGAQVNGLLHIEYHHTQNQVFAAPAIRIHAAESSSLNVVDHFFDTAFSCLHIRNLEVHLADHARVHIDKIQCGGAHAFVMNEDRITLRSAAEFRINTMTISGEWTRNMLHISLLGSNSIAYLNGFYAPNGTEFIDNHTCVYHAVPHCESHELYKGLLRESATGVFNGRIHVEKDAQKTNAFQSNANLLSGPEAKMYTKPELEIYADDVKCSHGSTTGQIDEEALFYLKARGLSNERATQLLSEAFFAEITEGTASEAVAKQVMHLLAKRGIVHTD